MMHASGSLAASFLLASFCAAPMALAASKAQDLVRDGIRYENAEGVARDYDKAHELYCSAARMNDAEAYLRMGWMYANARGHARDDQIANTLFRRAAKLGNDAAGRLAQMIRGELKHDKLPDCLVPRVAPLRRIDGLTPIVAADIHRMLAGPRRELARSILDLSREFELDPRLVVAVLRTESNFDPLARSPKNARGLMQLIPETAERFAVRNVHDPVENLRGGMRYLRWLLSYFQGDVTLALAGYNAGEGAVDRARGVPPYPETRAYVQRIRTLYPHDHHPFDARVTDPSRWLQPQARPAGAETEETTRSR